MTPEIDIRALAERVEVDFHRRPNRLRRGAWWLTLALVVVGGVWVVRAAARGDHRTFASGHVSNAHAFIENRCDLCHEKWSLWDRLASWDERVGSVSTDKCRDCHDGAEHNARQSPNHFGADLGCADCHREHRGNAALAAVDDERCVRCHEDLAKHTLNDLNLQAGSRPYHKAIRRFDSDSLTAGHPPFHLHTLLGSSPDGAQRDIEKGDPVALFLRDARPRRRLRAGEDPLPQEQAPTAKVQDRGRIAFNHQVHLASGLPGEDGKPVNLENECERCHQPDADRRLMRPIVYRDHCAECHPLRFDARFDKVYAPHGVKPEVVRGFLTDFYLRELRPGDALAAGGAAEPAVPRVLDKRLIPEADLKKARERARDAEKSMPAPLTAPIETALAERRVVESGSRGCRYCHDVKAGDDGLIQEIVPTNIPQRWFPHARFDHDSHRFVDCRSCHRNFTDPTKITEMSDSRDTGDVLIPTIDVCRKCHVQGGPKSEAGGRSPHSGTRTRCVECHTYHDRRHDQKKGGYSVEFPSRFVRREPAGKSDGAPAVADGQQTGEPTGANRAAPADANAGPRPRPNAVPKANPAPSDTK